MAVDGMLAKTSLILCFAHININSDSHVVRTLQSWQSQLTTDGTKAQWRHSTDPLIMLNTDMAIAYPMTTALPPLTGPAQTCGPQAPGVSFGCTNPPQFTPPSTWDLCLL